MSFRNFSSQFTISFSLLLLLTVLVTDNLQAQNWVLQKEEDSIRIYTAHTETSKIKSIKAEFTLHSTREALFEQLLRADLYHEWQFNTVESKILENINHREVVYYCEVAAPWPINNRDLIIHLKVVDNPGSNEFAIQTRAESNRVPLKNGVVRVQHTRGDWHVKQVGPKMLKVSFEFQVDPGGYVPAWLVNLTCAQAPFQTFRNLMSRLALTQG
jgi:hypothetical protein